MKVRMLVSIAGLPEPQYGLTKAFSFSPGDVVDLIYQGSKAQFRIVWCGKPGTEMAGEVGLESLSTGVTLWDVDPLRCAASVGKG